MSESVNDVVQVTVNVAPAAPKARGFSNALILGKSTVLPLSQRIRSYPDLPSVGVDFGPTTEEYKAASAWFSQKPRPSLIKIGRQFLAAQAGQLRGATVSATPLATFQAVTNGGFDIAIDGTNHPITALDLSAAASMAAVATDIQTKLNAAASGTTCTWNGSWFTITSPTTGTSSSIGYAVAPTGGGSPVDVSVLLGFSAGSGAQAFAGIATETVTAAWNASAIFDPNFYGVVMCGAVVQDIKDTMAFAEAGTYLHAYTVQDPAAKLSATTTDLFSFAKTNGYGNSFGEWNNGNPYAAVSALARLLIVDLTQPNSAITLKFKQQPGIPTDNLTATEIAALKAKNANYYTSFAAPGTDNGFAMLAEGVCGDGTFIDQVFNLAFMQARLQNAYFSTLATSPTKIEQTDHGVQRIVQALDKVMQVSVAAGISAPGVWNGDDLGEVKSGDYLPAGFYTYASPVSSQLQADRDARKAPPITIISTGAGAIHSGAVQYNFQP